MQISPDEMPHSHADVHGGKGESRASDLVYPAVTLLAMLLLLGSLWAF